MSSRDGARLRDGATKGDDCMADQTGRTDRQPNTAERRAAHERLSTGGLARWMRACATHPWRVVFAWVGIIAVLIFLVVDRRRQPEGRVLDPGLGHAEGDRPDRVRVRVRAGRRPEPRLRRARGAAARHARAEGGDRGRHRRAEDAAVQADGGQGRDRERRRPLQRRTRSRTTAGSRTPRRSSTASSTTRTARRSSRCEDAVREAVEPAGVTAEFNGDAEFPPIEQGTQELLGLLAALIVLLDRLPHARRDGDPDRARARRRSRRRSCCSSSSPA